MLLLQLESSIKNRKMVHLSVSRFVQMKTFGFKLKNQRIYNHRVPIQYQRFQDNLDPDEIIAHYSREDIDRINTRAGIRTYKDALETMGRKNILLPNLSSKDLELNELFQQELDRQRALVARINKINVIIDSVPGKDTELIMNQGISTPYDCASHLHQLISTRSVVAEISPLNSSQPETTEIKKLDGETSELVDETTNKEVTVVTKEEKPVYWDMHRPLEDNCRIKFRHFAEKNVGEVNKVYWRSCSFVLGMAIRLAFKDEIKVLLHSWPKPDIKSGSFVYDAALNLSDTWSPSEQELRAFTKVMWEIKKAALPFERLQVDRDVARKFFSFNPFKLAQTDSILENKSSNGKITVYRCGGLLDISIGPMIADTSQIGRITLAAVHPFESQSEENKGIFYRFQGVSLPQQLPMSAYLYQNVLIDNAKKLNKASL